ncbi:hypothetical protein CSA56_02370 [candidate division KSB3 bacterium]|uniref:Uncharacterized protein n=1 Tax=candidate division KSB3 bacterium TaxID=2044937 RepID=A0A2G6KJR7_9BACT|nr:MAG: hypothetical protein CSA56_02370 [candidate division KSB3 bacterium]
MFWSASIQKRQGHRAHERKKRHSQRNNRSGEESAVRWLLKQAQRKTQKKQFIRLFRFWGRSVTP